MRVGIVAEGRGDLGVLTRVLKGALDVDEDAIQFLRPEFDVDETDSYAMAAGERSNWSLVLEECRERRRMRDFILAQTDEPRVLVVHIDAAECGLPGFDVERPAPSDAAQLCERIERMIPGDSRSLAEDLRALSNGLEPLPEQLRTLGDQLVTTSSQLQTSSADLDVLAAQLDVLAGSIGDAAASLSEVDALARDIAQRAEEALDRSNSDLLVLRLLVVVLGVGIMAACIAAHRAVGALAVRQAAEPPAAPAP
jgi:hypothetical protein